MKIISYIKFITLSSDQVAAPILTLLPLKNMICSKCKIDKELDCYQVYWHSKVNKHYRRKECTTCFYDQKNKRKKEKRLKMKDPDYIYKNNPDYKKCSRCSTWNKIEDFLAKTNHKYSYCHQCRIIEAREIYANKLVENMGGEKYYIQPNTYSNDLQKTAVFNIMKALNWKFNEEKGIWYKPGIKDKNNKWSNIKPTKPNKFIFIRTPEIVEKMVSMRKKGKTKFEIATAFNCGATTVYNILKQNNLK